MSSNLTRVAAIPGSRAGLGGQACELEQPAAGKGSVVETQAEPQPKFTAIERALDAMDKALFDRAIARRKALRIELELTRAYGTPPDPSRVVKGCSCPACRFHRGELTLWVDDGRVETCRPKRASAKSSELWPSMATVQMERDLGISAVCGCAICLDIRARYLRGQWP